MNHPENLRQQAIRHAMFMRTPKTHLQDDSPYILTHGEGVRVTDIQGREYIDAMSSGGRATLVGYGRKEIAQAMYDQASTLHCHPAHHYISETTTQLVTKLAEIVPGDLSVTSLVSGGSEANESAFKLAKQYHLHKGCHRRSKIISRRGAFHGTTLGALSATGSMTPMREINDPLVAGYYFIPPPSCYRCPWRKEYPGCDLDCAQALEDQIQFEDPDQVALFIAEPVMQSRGVQVPPPEYFPRIREICDEYGVLLLDDEVITGFGRTGTWFACEQLDFVPDLMTMAKGFSSGYVPLGGIMMTPDIAETLPVFVDIRTYNLHPVTSAAALTNINIIENENLLERGQKTGAYLLDNLKQLAKHPIVGDVRGIGMWCAIEFVQDKHTKTPFPAEQNPVHTIAKKARDLGVLIGTVDQSIELAPPLVSKKADIDTIVQVVDEAIGAAV